MKSVHLRFEHGLPGARQRLLGTTGGHAAWCACLLLACSFGVAALCGWELVQARQGLAATQGELQALGRGAVAAAPRQPVLSSEQRRGWNLVIAQLNTRWATLLAGLEAATPETVALVAIEPDARQGSVRLQAEAKTLATLLDYAQALKTQPAFADVSPIKHETNEQDPNRPIRLTMNVRLRDDRAPVHATGGAAR